MKIESIPCNKLSFSKLFCDFSLNFSKVSDFFVHNPADTKVYETRAAKIHYNKDRSKLREILIQFNPIERIHPHAALNIERLTASEESFTVVTGQQLGFAGGPMFTLFKILTAIKSAQDAQKVLGVPVVPVFWLADEDHDFDEIARFSYPKSGEFETVELNRPTSAGVPVSQIELDEGTSDKLIEIQKLLIPNEYASYVSDALNKAYSTGNTHGYAFSTLISELFSRYGLLVLGSFNKNVRQFIASDLHHIIGETEAVYAALEEQSASVEKAYHRQASVSRSNWFFVNSSLQREKMTFENGVWMSESLSPISTEGLLKMMDDNPLCISPNVFMRPLMQDFLLPNLAYVAGPGEIAYYAQMRRLYPVVGLHMPVIIPRLSACIIEPSIARNLEELPFAYAAYSQRIEDLEGTYVESDSSFDMQGFSESWIRALEQLVQERSETVEKLDPTLLGTLAKTRQDQIAAVDNLRQKMARSAKSKREVQLKRISKTQGALFPRRNLQERELPFVYALNKFGPKFFEELLEHSGSMPIGQHHLILT